LNRKFRVSQKRGPRNENSPQAAGASIAAALQRSGWEKKKELRRETAPPVASCGGRITQRTL